MGISVNYDDDVKSQNMQRVVLPKVEAGRGISKQDIEVLQQATDTTAEWEPPMGVNSYQPDGAYMRPFSFFKVL